MEQIALLPTIGGILGLCILCQWIAWRMKLPAIIFLLFSGIVIGPVFDILNPEKLLGDFFFPFISLSVAIILFEGSLTLQFKDILGLEHVIRNMVSFGMAITWIITAVAARYLIGLSWKISFLFGAITVVTGPTVIVPMLRTVRPTSSIAHILRWEGIVIDPIGATLSILVYEFIIAGGGHTAFGHSLMTFGKLLLIGSLSGAFSGFFFGITIRNHWIPVYLQNLASFALVLIVFISANFLQPESGLLAVTVMGIWLANMKDVHINEILDFKESISILLISVLFIMLAARIDLSSMKAIAGRAIMLFAVIQFLARPLNIMASAKGSKLTWPERHLLAWIAPRGIVAAAMSALFAVQLEKEGFHDAGLIVPLTFSVIIGTVILQSVTARPIARFLKVSEPDPSGFLIIGANLVARKIAHALKASNVHVLLVDTDWNAISQARIEGLSTYFGNPISEHAERHLDLIGIGYVLALSAHEHLNAAAVMHYRMEVGRSNVFMLPSRSDENIPRQTRFSFKRLGRKLFGSRKTYHEMDELLSTNGNIHRTFLTDQFDFTAFMEKHKNYAVPLFALDKKGNVHIFCEDASFLPKPKWSVIYLLAPQQPPIITGG